jgi:hypothetical protein
MMLRNVVLVIVMWENSVLKTNCVMVIRIVVLVGDYRMIRNSRLGPRSTGSIVSPSFRVHGEL